MSIQDNKLSRWSLEDIYESPNSNSIEQDFSWIDNACRGFAERFEGRLAGLAGNALAGALAEFESILSRFHRLRLYACLHFQQDLQDPAAAKFDHDVETRLVDVTQPLVFFPPELGRMDETDLSTKYKSSPKLAHYRTWIDRERATRGHQLPDQLEQYIRNTSPTSSDSWIRLYHDTINNMDCEFDKKIQSLKPTLGRLQPRDQSRRQLEIWANIQCRHMRLFARIYNTLAKDREIEGRWRKLPTPQSFRHIPSGIEPEIVEALCDTVVDAYPRTSHRYYAMKAGWLDLPRLEFWDITGGVSQSGRRIYHWDEASGIVLDAFRAFSPVFGAEAERFFTENRIEARMVRAQKAFCGLGPANLRPYVFLNYWERPHDVIMLAHELGHAVHYSLASTQGELQMRVPRPLAETAGLFGEMLVFQKLLDGETDRTARRALSARMVENMISNVVRGISSYKFESQIHATRREGELQVEDFGRIWMETTRECLGPAVHLREEYKHSWCDRKNFIESPFCDYTYAFGHGLACALYNLHQREPEGFAEKYTNMLRAGGSLPHKEMLAPFDLDLHDPDFWKIGIDAISDIIDEAEALEDS